MVAMAVVLPLLPGYAVAQRVDISDEVCEGRASNSAFCKDADPSPGSNPIFGPQGFLTEIINLMSIVVGIVAVFAIIFAGIRFITSSNNPQEVTTAREVILYALVALVIAALAQVIVRFFLSRIGVN